MSSETNKLAEQIADALMTTGFGDRATRLALKQSADDGEIDLGGWCRRSVVSTITETLSGTRYTPQALPDVPEGWDSWEDWLAEKGITITSDHMNGTRRWHVLADVSLGPFPTYPAALAAAIEHGKGVEDAD